MGNARADDRRRELGAGRHTNAPVVEIGALAFLGDIGVVGYRVVDQPRDEFAVALQRDRNAEDRNAVQEIRGAVERVHDPAMGGVGTRDLAALFHQESVAGPRLGKFGEDDLLRTRVRGADEVRRAFERDLQVLDLAEVAGEAAAGLAGGPDHDVHQRGCGHGIPVP